MTAQETGTANWYSTVSTAVMGATDTSLTVDSVDGAPVPPCYLVVEGDNASQREVMLFTGLATKTFTGATVATNRYLAGSAAGSGLTHPSGSVVEMRPISQLFADLNDRVDALGSPVAASLFDANTILKADADNTPAALTMGASTILARLAAGSIVAATPGQLRTLLDVPTTGEAILDTIVDAEGDLIVGDDPDTVKRLAMGTALQVLRVNAAGTALEWAAPTTAGIIAVRKTADESVTSSTAYQSDDQLLFAIAANETWVADFMLIVTGDTAGDIRTQFTVPAGATVSVAGFGPAAAATTSAYDGIWFGDAAAGVFGQSGTLSGTAMPVFLRAIVANAGTAGNVTLQWAQGTSSGTATIVKAGSSLIAVRVG